MALSNLFGWSEEVNVTPAAACGSACGASDNPAPTACGADDKPTPSACGADDKPSETPSACGASDK